MTLVFTITEALIGRQLVKLGLVNESEHFSRLVVMPLHLINTSLLLISEVMTAEGIKFGMRVRQPLSVTSRRWSVIIGSVLLLLLTSGAIAALGAHLFPSVTLLDGLIDDFSENAHPALRLRVLHPLLALILPLVIWSVLSQSHRRASTPELARMYREFAVAVLIMIVVGIATLVFLSPVWLKFAHLTIANLLVVLAARCLFHTLRPT
jgi:cytochrome c oxidase assembly protein subunit 15